MVRCHQEKERGVRNSRGVHILCVANAYATVEHATLLVHLAEMLTINADPRSCKRKDANMDVLQARPVLSFLGELLDTLFVRRMPEDGEGGFRDADIFGVFVYNVASRQSTPRGPVLVKMKNELVKGIGGTCELS